MGDFWSSVFLQNKWLINVKSFCWYYFKYYYYVNIQLCEELSVYVQSFWNNAKQKKKKKIP